MRGKYLPFGRKIQRSWAIVVGCLLWSAGNSIVVGQQAKSGGSAVVSRTLPYVVMLRAYDSNGTKIGLGSGFILQNGRIATSLHVVSGADWVEVTSNEGALMGTLRYAEAISASMDLAILPRIANLSGGLGLSLTEATAGTRVWVIGSPKGLGGSVSSGIVSAVRTVDGRRYIQISAPVSRGSSGGPILDRHGNVIGVVTGIMEEGQNLNFGIPASALAVLRAAEPLRIPFPGAADSRAGNAREASGGTANVWEELFRLARELSIPSFESGRLSSDDADIDGQYFDIFRISGDAGTSLRIGAVSAEFDTYLMLMSVEEVRSGVEEPWAVEDDDSGSGTNSILNVRIPASGPYLLFITSYEAGETGEYLLNIRTDAGEQRQFAGGQGLDERWHYVGTSVSDTRYWIDSESLERDGNHVDVWHYTKYSTLQHTSDGEAYDAATSRFRYDCQGRRSAFLAVSYYRDRQLVDSIEGSDVYPDWSAIVPGSMAEAVFQMVCNGR